MRASIDRFGGDPSGPAFGPSISDHDRYVVFDSAASDLVANDLDGFGDVFVRDMAGVFASVGDAAVPEGDGGTTTAYFTLSLDRVAPADVVAAYTTFNGSAVDPLDFTNKAGTVTIAAGTCTVLLPISLKSDRIHEGDEHFFLEVTGVIGARLTRQCGTGTILDDDT